MELNDHFVTIEAQVRQVFRVEDTTLGSSKDSYLVRYRGRLVIDSEVAYDQLAAQLKPLGVMPLFRWDGENHAILIIPGLPTPKASNPWINLGLFLATLLSVLLTGGLYGLQQPLPAQVLPAILLLLQNGWPFAVSLVAILGTHEFGHYLMGRHHGVHVSLPYFIPFPFSIFGTLGAFINMKEIPKNRKVLLDIGIAGPLSGLVVALPILYVGLKQSALSALPLAGAAGAGISLEGNSVLYLLFKYLAFGQLLPQPASYAGIAPLVYWLRFFFTSHPYPYGGQDVMLGPVAWAGWAGLLVTAMNLIPAGQLDGGHTLFVLFGRKWAARIRPFILGALILLGLAWNGWWLWAALIFFFGRYYAEPLDLITPINTGRKALAVLALLVFLLTFTPVPFSLFR